MVTAAERDTEIAAIVRGDPDQADDLAKTIHRHGTEADIPKVTENRTRVKDQGAPTPTTTGEGITAGMIRMLDTHGATLGTGTDPRTADTGSKDPPITAQAGDSDSSRRETDGACRPRLTSNHST